MKPETIILTLIIILIFVEGFMIGKIFSPAELCPKCKIQHGYYFQDSQEPHFDYGDWVCVNVKNMSFEMAYEVCRHEVGHEIYAEFCEGNLDRCINLTLG